MMFHVEFYAISLDCLHWSFTLFPMKMNFSFGLMVWIVRNLCIMLETWDIHPELIHHVSWETTVKFDSKYTWALSSPFFSNQDLHFRQSFWKCLDFLQNGQLLPFDTFFWICKESSLFFNDPLPLSCFFINFFSSSLISLVAYIMNWVTSLILKPHFFLN